MANCKELRVRFDLPLIIHSRGIHLEVSPDSLCLKVGVFYLLSIKLPVAVNP